MSDEFQVHAAISEDDILKVKIVRGIVFIEEQKVQWDGEMDEFEEESWHYLGEIDGEPVAAGRLRQVADGTIKVERIAVRPAWRGRGYGEEVVQFLIDEAIEKGARKLAMHAQIHLQDFYAKFGFVAQGEIFSECGIEHMAMVREVV